jgi:hypothetical protein
VRTVFGNSSEKLRAHFELFLHQFTRENGLKVRQRLWSCQIVCAFCLFSAQGSEDEANHFGREFTNIERHEPLQKRFLRRSMVELLNIRADFPHFTSRIVEHSRYLPNTALSVLATTITIHSPNTSKVSVRWY